PPQGVAEDIIAFINFVAESGSESALSTFVDTLLDDSETPLAWIRPLTSRLSPEARRAILPRVIKRDGDVFETTLAIADNFLGEFPFAALSATPILSALPAMFQKAVDDNDPERTIAARQIDLILPRIGLLLDAQGARAMLSRLADLGLSPPEPRLEMLL